jgi:hypothetical protein
VQVDTVKQTLGYEVTDETEHGRILAPLIVSGKPMAEIASGLQTFLEAKQRCSGTVVLQRDAVSDYWAVRCGPPELAHIDCLAIDPETGDINQTDK